MRIRPAEATAQSSRVNCTICRMVRMPAPSSPTRQANASVNSTSLEALERLPSLSLRRCKRSALTEAVGPKARHEEAGEPARRLRQHQEGVAHRRGEEPFVADDGIAVAIRRRRRGVGAHVGAALLLGHAHAERHAGFFPPRPKCRVVAARLTTFGTILRGQLRLGRERGKRGARHGDRAQMSGLDLRRHVEARRARDFGRRRAHACRLPVQVEACRPGGDALAHQLMIGRMELDRVAAKSLGVEGMQLRRILVGLPRRARTSPRCPIARRTRTAPSTSPAPPLAATASRSGRSLENRSTFS